MNRRKPLVEMIIASHTASADVEPGNIVIVDVDAVYLQDGNTPTAHRYFEQHGFHNVFDPERVIAYFDHGVLSADSRMTDRLREAEKFAESLKIVVRRAGEGISHVLALEDGVYAPGKLVVGADSHTCTGGVVQCLSLGMGVSDIVAAMVTGRTWLRVPETVWIEITGYPARLSRSKDVILHALARFGQQPFLGKSVEWCGPWVSSLSLDEAATIANMAVEQGAECCFLPPGAIGRPEGMRQIEPLARDSEHCFSLDISDLGPRIAQPHDPCNTCGLDECAGTRINYVFIGTCANGRLEDLREVARVLAGRRVHAFVHLVITPGSRRIYLAALAEGLIEVFVQAGAIVTPPGCGACVGTGGIVPASGDNVLSTANRNFQGRMGNSRANVWLASPLVAAHGAIVGRIPSTKELA
jgi:3-isopropylmalate/(R)-2-methylmalate dehydratase large subunit